MNGFSLPAWTDIFSALQPYQDPSQPAQYVPLSSGKELTGDDLSDYELNLNDQGSPRFGLVQVRMAAV